METLSEPNEEVVLIEALVDLIAIAYTQVTSNG